MLLIDLGSDDFWKILKYGKTDVLINPSYTVSLADKYEMVKPNNKTNDGKELTRVKTAKFNDDISTEAHTEIRIVDGSWSVPEKQIYDIAIGVEIISHNSLIALDGVGKRTINILRHEIYKIFNNADVYKNIGQMTNVGTRGQVSIFNNEYQGYQFSLIARSS